MKFTKPLHAVTTLLLIIALRPALMAQDLAMITKPVALETRDYVNSYRTPHPHIGPVTITGICLTSAGPFVVLAGVFTEMNGYRHGILVDQSSVNTGKTMEYAGVVMVAAGITMCIWGGIHDHTKRRFKILSSTSPGKNEMGIAYTF